MKNTNRFTFSSFCLSVLLALAVVLGVGAGVPVPLPVGDAVGEGVGVGEAESVLLALTVGLGVALALGLGYLYWESAVAGVRASRLTAGDSVDFASPALAVTPASWKAPLAGREHRGEFTAMFPFQFEPRVYPCGQSLGLLRIEL